MQIQIVFKCAWDSHQNRSRLVRVKSKFQQNPCLFYTKKNLDASLLPHSEIKINHKKLKVKGKTIKHVLLSMPKPLTVWITTNCGKLFNRWEYQTTWPASWEICMQVKKQQLELDMEQQTGSKLGKEHLKAVYCHPAYLTYMQSTSWETPGWMKHKLESRLPGEISITSDMQMTPPLWQ